MKYKPYPAYKDSGVEWLGAVPAGWETHRLRWMFQRKKETNRPEAELLSVYRDYGVIPKSSRDDNFNKPSDDLSVYQFVERGDLVLNKMKTWQGSIAVSDYEGIVSPAYYVARPLKEVNLRFIHYLLRSPLYISQYNLLSAGIRPNQWDLDFDDFRDLLALLPSRHEQTAIAAFLDCETVRIDTLIAKQEKLIQLLQEKRQALISHAVTKGLNSDVPMKDSGVEWLGEVPAHWAALTVRRIAESVQTGGTPSIVESAGVLDEGQVWYTPGDFGQSLRLGSSARETSRDAFISGDAKAFPPRSVLVVSIGATLGKVGFSEFASSANQQVNAVVPGCNVDGYFLAYSLSVKTEAMKLLSNASTIGIMNQEKTKEIWLAAPPIEEQELITSYLDRETAKLDNLIEKSRRSIDLMREHRTALISAAVTGKIDVRAQHQAAA